jgi:hypothetical protein
MKVSFRYDLSYGGIPPSSRVSLLKTCRFKNQYLLVLCGFAFNIPG